VAAAAVLSLAPPAPAQTGEVTGTATDRAGNVSTLDGTFTIRFFRASGDQLLAVGTINGTLTNEDGQVVRRLRSVPVALPVDLEESGFGIPAEVPVSTTVEGSQVALPAGGCACSAGRDEAVESVALQPPALECDVLNLVLGPLDLNLLGLEIDLNQVILNIVADPSGGLLGQLLSILCGLNLGGLLDLLGGLGDLAGFLNFLLLLFSLFG
jgi:hypothetical protein